MCILSAIYASESRRALRISCATDDGLHIVSAEGSWRALEAGDRVVVDGQFALRDGTPVALEDAPAAN